MLVLVRNGRVTVPAAILLFAATAFGGLVLGNQRLAAIDGRAFQLPANTARGDPGFAGAERSPAGAGGAAAFLGRKRITLSGFVEAEPGRSRGTIRFRFSTSAGRLMVETKDPGAKHLPATGDGLNVRGHPGRPPDWYRPVMDRHGLLVLLRADAVIRNDERRSGITGLVDRMRDRAASALAVRMPGREAALARGFVLGQDAAIDARTTADFRASGLSHLLAVSGQNVVLLGLLAWPVLALAGAGIRARRLWTVLLILVYIPLAGGEPSIQRAGVMGIAILAAATAGRTSSRAWVLTLAAAVTLALDPRAVLDPGWQLSFAAVIGIAAAAGPLRDRLRTVTGTGGWRTALLEGFAVTLAASVATAPLIAFHFGRLPVGTIAANLAVLPAVAPAMWLGMISAAVGQVWSGLAVPFNLVNSVALGMIAQVAAWFGRPAWAEAEIAIGGAGLAAVTVVTAGFAVALFRFWKPPDPKLPDTPFRRRNRHRAGLIVCALAAAAVVLGPRFVGHDRRELPEPAPGGVRIEFLDVGQGDAILVRPSGADPVLIDGGPPGGDLAGGLDSAGVKRLSAVILTHPDLDHYGGLFDVFGRTPVSRFLFDSAPGKLVAAARSAGALPLRAGQGDLLRPAGRLRLELLWPPPARGPNGRGDDPNDRSIGVLLGFGRFRMYLPGDAEAESVPVDPGPLDVLKVAHHGSADSGLGRLLSRSRPAVGLIGVGRDNPYGHPTAETVTALDEAGARVYRTDRDGTVSVVAGPRGYRIETGR